MLRLADRIVFSLGFGATVFLLFRGLGNRSLGWSDFLIFVLNPLAILILFDWWQRFVPQIAKRGASR